MKKIFFYTFCLLLIVVSSCNNADEEKSSATDSTKVTEPQKTAAVSPGFQISAADAEATWEFLSQQYIIFENTTQYVTFNYKEFLKFIDSVATGNPKPSPDVYLVYGALTKIDTARYISAHPNLSAPDKKELLNEPCLLEGYELENGDFAYNDKTMALCPPPTSCQASFEIKADKVKIYNANPLNPEATINNFNVTYDGGGTRDLTKSVRFNIETLKYWKKHFDDSLKITAPDISFFMGAYTKKDAERNGQEVGKPCLIFAYQYGTDPAGKPKFLYVDFGILVPQ